jgi:uncharacterized protein YraI
VTPTTDKIQPPPRKNKLAKRWILIALLALLLVAAAMITTPALSSYAPILGNLLVTPSLSPTVTATAPAAATAPATATAAAPATATAKATATAAATSTRTPTATQTMTPQAATENTIKVASVTSELDLREGPGRHYAAIQSLNYDEPLTLLGRYIYKTWLYVSTADGQKGWVRINTVDTTGISLAYQPVKTPSSYPDVTITLSASVNLRAGPSMNFSKLGKLSYGDPLTLLGQLNDHTWLYVRTSAGQEGWVQTISVFIDERSLLYDYYPIQTPPPTETSTPVILPGIEGRWIDIDLSEQMLYANEGATRVAAFQVSTGTDLYPTEVGQFHIYVKYLFADMRGNDYYLPDVPFVMYYSGDFGIHGTFWHRNFGTPMSRGCVNMDIRDSEWLFNWASVGTLVNIHR